MPEVVSSVRSPKARRLRPVQFTRRRAAATVDRLPLQLLALGLLADGASSEGDGAATQYVRTHLRHALRDADEILRASLSTSNTTIAETLYQRAAATKEYAALQQAIGNDQALSTLVCTATERSVFAGIALAYRFFVEVGR